MARLVLMCGVAGSGKSTYARALEAQGWLRVSIDTEAWERGLRVVPLPASRRPGDPGRFNGSRSRRRWTTAATWSSTTRSGRGRSVTTTARSGGLHGADVEVVHLDVTPDELRRRLALRRTAHADDFVVPSEVLDGYLAGFEPPGPDEEDVTVVPD